MGNDGRCTCIECDKHHRETNKKKKKKMMMKKGKKRREQKSKRRTISPIRISRLLPTHMISDFTLLLVVCYSSHSISIPFLVQSRWVLWIRFRSRVDVKSILDTIAFALNIYRIVFAHTYVCVWMPAIFAISPSLLVSPLYSCDTHDTPMIHIIYITLNGMYMWRSIVGSMKVNKNASSMKNMLKSSI